jgi:hypothetical protein
MSLVYRVQNKDGMGPYNCGCHPDPRSSPTKPTPQNDIGILRRPEYSEEFCGFQSLQSLLDWFPDPILVILHEKGFFICVIEAEITAWGQYQVLFKRSKLDTLYSRIIPYPMSTKVYFDEYSFTSIDSKECDYVQTA